MSKNIKFRSLMNILYALIMLLPLSSVGFRCAYTIFNKNAYESFSGNTEQLTDYQLNYKYTSNEVDSADDLLSGNIYQLNLSGNTSNGLIAKCTYVYGSRFSYSDYYLVVNVDITQPDYLEIYANSSNVQCKYYHNGVNVLSYDFATNKQFVFVYDSDFNADYLSYV